MVGNEDHAIRKIALQPSILGLSELSAYTLVAAHAHDGGTPPLRHGRNEQTKVLLGNSHPGIVPVFVVKIERRAEKLADVDANTEQGG